MSFNLRRSISNPDLMVSQCGIVFEADSGVKVPVLINHPTSIRGPIATYKSDGKYRTVSIQRMVYEAHVKRSRLPNSEQVEALDGDDMNVNAANLVRSGKRLTQTNKKREDDTGYSSWMGSDEIFC